MHNIKKKILVTDDDPAILEVITMILEDAGYEVKTIDNRNTEKYAEEYLPDAILLDIWMGGVDGRNICKKLKSKKNTAHIPIIIISANKDTEMIAKAAGADGYIKKPFELNDILVLVKKITTT